MAEHPLIERLRAARVVPVVRTSVRAARGHGGGWLRDAGLRIFEITMTIPDAPALIRELSARSSAAGRRRHGAGCGDGRGVPGGGRALHRGALDRCRAGAHPAAPPGRC